MSVVRTECSKSRPRFVQRWEFALPDKCVAGFAPAEGFHPPPLRKFRMLFFQLGELFFEFEEFFFVSRVKPLKDA